MVSLKLEFPNGFFDEEVRSGYLVSAEMKKLWAVELDLLSEFDRVCKQFGISYMACGGTLLGAARHKGFIPWDDDIDVMMFRDQYEKLRSVASNAFEAPYFFQDGYTDKGSIRGHAQLRNSNTTGIRIAEKKYAYPFNQGIFIDIFPLDNIPDDEKTKAEFISGLKAKRERVVVASNRSYRYTKQARAMKKWFKRPYCDLRQIYYFATKAEQKAFAEYDLFMQKYNSEKTKKATVLSILAAGEKTHWFIDDLGSPLHMMPFEFLEIPVPEKYENLLAKQYGNWQEFVMGGSYHGELFVDTDNPYLNYI